MVGGVTQNITDSVVAYLVEDGCHVQDMYYASQYDSESLKFGLKNFFTSFLIFPNYSSNKGIGVYSKMDSRKTS